MDIKTKNKDTGGAVQEQQQTLQVQQQQSQQQHQQQQQTQQQQTQRQQQTRQQRKQSRRKQRDQLTERTVIGQGGGGENPTTSKADPKPVTAKGRKNVVQVGK
uniref:Uncharacterized protein n=1 Tax=Rhodnius prolixus TaxID=13249 RepID=T1HZS3_RHOPR